MLIQSQMNLCGALDNSHAFIYSMDVFKMEIKFQKNAL